MAIAHNDLGQADDALLVHASYSEEAGHEATMQLLELPAPPDAIIYASDHSAKGGLLAAAENSVRVPDSLAVIGMGDLLRPREAPVALTTIDTRSQDLGRLAASTLRGLIKGQTQAPIHQSVAPELLVRDSA